MIMVVFPFSIICDRTILPPAVTPRAQSSRIIDRTYAVAQLRAFAAVLYLLLVFRFFALRAKKRKTDEIVEYQSDHRRLNGISVWHYASPVIEDVRTAMFKRL
jgi:hypothetical protein